MEHIAECAAFFIVAAAMLHAERLRRCNLHMIDVSAIPNRLDNGVGKPKRKDILHRLFAEIVVNSINLLFLEYIVDIGIEQPRRI